MSLRDKALTGLGLGLTTLGIVFTVLWSVKSGIVMLLLLGFLLCLLFILQRKQMSRVQQRLLKLTDLVKAYDAEIEGVDHRQLILHKRLLGHIQAQQISMERLHNKLDDIPNNDRVQ